MADQAKSFTPREREVVALIALALSNKEIALVLGTSESNIKQHVKHILAKLGARNRTRAALIWGSNQEGDDLADALIERAKGAPRQLWELAWLEEVR
jgi:DNA-binding CsgD family transcriptional regulator